MRIHLSLKLFKLLVLVFSSVAIMIAVSSFFVNAPGFVVEHSCLLIENTNSFCGFNCSFKPLCEEDTVSVRIMVTHTVIAGIFDKTFNASCGVNNYYIITLPRRNYLFNLHAAFFDDEISASNSDYLFC